MRDGWLHQNLGEVLQLHYGKSLPKSERKHGEYLVYGSNGVVGFHDTAAVSGPGIIIGRKGSCGEVHYSEDDFWPIDTTYYVTPKTDSNLRFIAYLLSSLGLNRMNSHSTIPGLNRDRVYKTPLWLPPLPEQEKIAAVLLKIQQAISVQDEIIRSLQDLKKSTMRFVFSRGLRGEKTKQTGIGAIPESWEEATLGILCGTGKGCIQTGPFGSQLHASDYQEFGVPVVNPTHMMNNQINHKNIPRVSEEDAERLNRHLLRNGDILFARRGDIGRHALVREAEAGWLCGTGCFLVRVGDRRAVDAFVCWFLCSEGCQNWLVAHAAGAIMPNLNNRILRACPVAFPGTLEEQGSIVGLLDKLDSEINLHESKKITLQDLFRTTLNRLMTGEVEMSELDIDTDEVKS